MERVSVSLPAQVYEQLKQLAKKNRRSYSSQAALLIEEALEQIKSVAEPSTEVSK